MNEHQLEHTTHTQVPPDQATITALPLVSSLSFRWPQRAMPALNGGLSWHHDELYVAAGYLLAMRRT